MIIFLGINPDFYKIKAAMTGYTLQDGMLLFPSSPTAKQKLQNQLQPFTTHRNCLKLLQSNQFLTLQELTITKVQPSIETAIIDTAHDDKKVIVILDTGATVLNPEENIFFFYPIGKHLFLNYAIFPSLESLLSCSFLGQDWQRGYKFHLKQKNEQIFFYIDEVIAQKTVMHEWHKQEKQKIQYIEDDIIL